MNAFQKLISNYKAQNTPELAHKIGNWLLSLGALGVSIKGAPVLLAEAGLSDFTLPSFVDTIAKVLIALGVFGKIFTKFMGTDETK